MEDCFNCAVCLGQFKSKTILYRHITRKKHCISACNSLSTEKLGIILPAQWKYGNCKVFNGNFSNSSISMYVYDIHSKNDVLSWLNIYMKENKMKFICCGTRTKKHGLIYLFYRCEHYKDQNRETKMKQRIKGTGCKSAIYFSLQRGLVEVKICYIRHNHPLDSAAVLGFSKPTAEVEQIFITLFSNGLGPTDALNTYKNHMKLQAKSDIEYLKISSDRSKIPDYDWVRYLYMKSQEKKLWLIEQ